MWEGSAKSGKGRGDGCGDALESSPNRYGKLVAARMYPTMGITGGIRKVIHGKLVAAPTVSWSRPRRKTAGPVTVSWSPKPIYNTYIFLTCSLSSLRGG